MTLADMQKDMMTLEGSMCWHAPCTAKQSKSHPARVAHGNRDRALFPIVATQVAERPDRLLQSTRARPI